MLTRRLVLSSALQAFSTAAIAGPTPAPKDAYLYIIWPTDGARIKGAFWCRFGLRNMGVTHAGDKTPNMGHHHLLVDVDAPLDPNEPIPLKRDNYLHFGAGQTEVKLTLPEGQHTLQLVLADQNHMLHDPPVLSERITVIVRAGGPKRGS